MSLNNQKFNVTFGLEEELPNTYTAGTMRVCIDTNNVYLDLDTNRIKLSINADTAVKLATAVNIQSDLSSNTAASFDGSTNILPGVTGILPIANGGTGVTTIEELQQLLSLTTSGVGKSTAGMS